MKKLITYLPYLSFALFFLNKFFVATIAKSTDIHSLASTVYYINQTLVIGLLFLYVRLTYNKKKIILNSVLGFFVAELISQLFYNGLHSWIEFFLYLTAPTIAVLIEKKTK